MVAIVFIVKLKVLMTKLAFIFQQGTSGDPMYLIANYVKIFLKGFQDLFQYHVKFTPDVENKKFRREIISQHKVSSLIDVENLYRVDE